MADARHITRRFFFRQAALASAVGAAIAAPPVVDAVAAEPDPKESPELIDAWKQFREDERGYLAAKKASGKTYLGGEAMDNLEASARRVMEVEATTDEGIRIKGDVMMAINEAWGLDDYRRGCVFGLSHMFVCAVMNHTAHLDD